MKRQLIITLFLIALLQLTGNSVAENMSSLEIRGSVATGSAEWDASTFAGFYYDIDDNIATETMTFTVTDRKLLEPDGVVYNTVAMEDDFDFDAWGKYLIMGFLAEPYFAGYVDTPDTTDDVLYEESDDENVLADEQLLKILYDFDFEMTVTAGTPLKLQEGYVLEIKSVDANTGEVYLELSKNGSVVDSKVIAPSNYYAGMSDKTYYYKKDIGDSKDVVIIAAHFKNAFRATGQYMVTIDGLWHLSDSPTYVSENTKYGKMVIQTVNTDSITMNNEDNDIILSKNADISLVPGINITTADADELRYYIYKEITEPGTYEIRSNVATDTATWTADGFAGFYYDFDDDFKTEELTTTVTDGKLLEPDGITYSTAAERNSFEYSDWGYYNAIGFMGKKYFAGYIEEDSAGTNPDILADADNVNLLDLGSLTEILIDKSQETVQDLSSSIELEEGYSLKLTVGSDKKGLLAELFKDKKLVDKKAVLLPGTYVYTSSLGNATGVPLIAAYFQEPIFLESKSCFKINGLWQISENAIHVRKGDLYGNMKVYSIDPDNGAITLNNEDNDVTLSKNTDFSLMPSINIKTADADELRYYLYREVSIDHSPEEISSGGKA
ncbi:MAG: S-layer protein [Methanothrix sp.]|nr:S-layer protein [Methanothrix sp.]